MRGRDEEELKAAKLGFKEAAREGNHEEEGRWANVLGDIHKRRGEYVHALKWLRVDYEVSMKHLPCKQLLPTCQSLGEIYFLLGRLKEALVYQKKHLQLAKDSEDLVEQQRASTQLGRTYHEIFLSSENDHYAIRNAKKYYRSAMKLAGPLKERAASESSSVFLKELIDAHNNIGLLELDLDNLEEAENFLLQGLKICDDEEIGENDDARSRLHHNLGKLYVEQRDWGKARDHTQKDILICKRIGHTQGEAKGFINLGELHYRVQKYDVAIRCYQKALGIAKSMEDEDALVDLVRQNIETVKEAARVLEELNRDEQKLKKLMRSTCDARGTPNERKCLLEQNTCLDSLIEKSNMIFAWSKHQEFAKRKKKVASELCDREKLSDAFLAIGVSYQKLRNFNKARKWYMKSWNVYRSIGNLEGEALAKINIGEVLDSSGDWAGALQAFEEGYRLAVEGKLLSVELSALENMHYSHMIRFDNLEEARKLQHAIQKLRLLLKDKNDSRNFGSDYCSETETEGSDHVLVASNGCDSADGASPATSKLIHPSNVEEIDEDAPLVSLIRRKKKDVSETKQCQSDYCGKKASTPRMPDPCIKVISNSDDNQLGTSRKRPRIIISDDEADEAGELHSPEKRVPHYPSEELATFDIDDKLDETTNEPQDGTHHSAASKDMLSSCTPVRIEESACSFRSRNSNSAADNDAEMGFSSGADLANSSRFASSRCKLDSGYASGDSLGTQKRADLGSSDDHNGQCFTFIIGDETVRLNLHSFMDGGILDIERAKAEVACAYVLQLSDEKRSKGLLPVIGQLKCCGKALGSLDQIRDFMHSMSIKNVGIEVVIDGWVPKRLMKSYIDNCEKIPEAPNMKLLRSLYNLEVSEDEIVISGCGLQDLSIAPLLNALEVHKTVALLDLSHNLLGRDDVLSKCFVGNETMERVRHIFSVSSQKYGGLTIDLHCNRFGPSALFQICECSVMFSRLEVLNLSENRLTDACSSYLCTILENCQVLYSLNIEACSITSRTVQKVSDTLHDGLVLSRFFLGRNFPISGNAMVNLLAKLASMKRFSELSLDGIRLNKLMVDGLCQLATTSSLSSLLIGRTQIGAGGALRLTEAFTNAPQELVKLDLSCCGLTPEGFSQICANIASIGGIVELNLGGNSIGKEGCDALGAILMDPQCSLRSLALNKCHLGVAGIVQIVQALAGKDSLEELYLAENADIAPERTIQFDSTTEGNSKPANETCTMNMEHHGLEVADSEDDDVKERTQSCADGSCASSCQKNPFAGCQLIQGLSSAIALANQLQLLDLSKNGFPNEVIETLYTSWASSGSRCGGLAQKHIRKDQTLHFSVEGKKCCGIKPCCRRD